MARMRFQIFVFLAVVALTTTACGPSSSGNTLAAGYHGDTWIWDGVTWSLRNLSNAPSRRAGAAFAYDERDAVGVLFGGDSPDASLEMVDDTWTWDGRSWTHLHPTASPTARWRASMVFDEKRQTILLFGGWGLRGSPDSSTIGYLNDTWTWNGSVWNQLHPELSPPAEHSQLAFDAVSNLVVLTNGSETWTWDGTTWTPRDDTPTPPGASTAGLSQDRHGLILYGGGGCNMSDLAMTGVNVGGPVVAGPLGATWAWSGKTWAALQPALSPIALCNPSLVYDSQRRESVLFGGRIGCSEYENYTYAWNGSTWIQKTSSVSPEPRAETSMAYDSARGEVVLFGGFSLNPECGFANLP